jgi:hypothetical protein
MYCRRRAIDLMATIAAMARRDLLILDHRQLNGPDDFSEFVRAARHAKSITTGFFPPTRSCSHPTLSWC